MPPTLPCQTAAGVAGVGGVGPTAASCAGRTSDSCSRTATIAFNDAIGMLWYALLVLENLKVEQRHESIWKRVRCCDQEGVPHGRGGVGEGAVLPSTHVAFGGGVDLRGRTGTSHAGVSPSSIPTVSVARAAQRDVSDFDDWGRVDWTLLAAHVYALTRELHSARALHRFVAENIYEGMFSSNRGEMCATYAVQHAEAIHLYAKEAQGEERRGMTGLHQFILPSAGNIGANRLADAVSVLQAAPPPMARSSFVTGGHSACPDGMTAVQCSASSSHIPRSSDARAPPGSLFVSSDISASSLVPQQWGGAPLISQTTCAPLSAGALAGGVEQKGSNAGAGNGGRVGSRASAGVGTATRTSSQSSLAGEGVLGCHAAAAGDGDVSRGVVTRHGPLPTLSTYAESGNASGHVGHSYPAVPGASLNTDAVPKVGQAITPLPTTLSFEPDPHDAPWYALWSSLPSPQARAQLHLLRYATPLSLENFSSLLEQFFLVDGADDFLSPVHAATIMEFAGVRSGPYNTIVRSPLSLAEVRRYISESHRHYVRAAAVMHSGVAEGVAGLASTSRSLPGTHLPVPASPTVASYAYEASHTLISGSGPPAPSVTATTKAEHRGLRRGGALPSEALGSDARSLLDCTASSERRVLTLAELERSVWHVAANCVFFNAPETRYPRTARHFAAACISIMTRYCEKQLASAFYAS